MILWSGEKRLRYRIFSARGEIRPLLHQQDVSFCIQQKNCLFCLKNMEEKAHHILKEENTVTELTVKRKDQVEVALSGKEFSRRDFAVFTAKRDGSNSAFCRKRNDIS